MKLNFFGWFWGNGIIGIRWAGGISGFQIRFYFFIVDCAMQFEYSEKKKKIISEIQKQQQDTILKATVTGEN